MKIKQKLIGIFSVLTVALVSLGGLALYFDFIVVFAVTATFLSIIAGYVIYTAFFKRIKILNDEVVDIQSGSTKTKKVKVEGSDEITELASRINVLIETLYLSRKQLFLLSEKPGQQLTDEEPSATETIKNTVTGATAQADDLELPGRIEFNKLFNKALSFSKRNNKVLAILIIDVEKVVATVSAIDRKLENDVLKVVCEKFSGVLRNEDTLAKLDGNEFVVLLNDIGKPKFASAVAEKLLTSISENLPVDDKEVLVRASIGVCIFPNDGNNLEEFIEKAYSVLYKAKATPGNSYRFYTNDLDLEAREYLHLSTDIRKAISKNELVLHYQPKINIQTGAISGVEVLIRWMHPELGLLPPSRFISVAEDSSYIMQIGEWAIREACNMNMYWQKEGYEHITVAVNLSPNQLFDPDLINILATVIEETKLDPSYLELEINESTLMGDLENAAIIMRKITSLGVKISIDHFGKGYTSISHLKYLPVSSVKIDRGFIKGVPVNADDCAIASGMVALAHNMGIEVTAEGVENAEQLQFLTTQNCDLVQGYFLSYPLPAQTVTQHFKKIIDQAMN